MNKVRFSSVPTSKYPPRDREMGSGDNPTFNAIIFMKTFLTFFQRVPKTVVGTDKEMAAGDDVTVMETVSTSSVGSQDAVSGMSVSAREKNAAMPTAAMSDLSYVIYQPEDLENKEKDSDVDG